jgi:hypothetical protein
MRRSRPQCILPFGVPLILAIDMAAPLTAVSTSTISDQSMEIPASAATSASFTKPITPITSILENDGLLQYVARSIDEDEDFYFLRFESLQRTNIAALQLKLVRIKDSLRSQTDVSDTDLETLRLTLEQYS